MYLQEFRGALIVAPMGASKQLLIRDFFWWYPLATSTFYAILEVNPIPDMLQTETRVRQQ